MLLERLSCAALLVTLAACASQTVSEPASKPPEQKPAAETVTNNHQASNREQGIEKDPASNTPAAQPGAGAAAHAPFTRPNVKPPFERSARPGDGEWTRLGDAATGDRAGTDSPVFLKTTLHPHPSSRFMSVTIAAVDLQSARLRYVPGADDFKAPSFENGQTPGLIPDADQARLLAVFNGGFKPAHGRWGMLFEGQSIVPPRAEGCTLAIFKSEAVAIAAWPELEARAAELRSYRQTPPCLLSAGVLHPKLQANDEKPWGGNVPNLVTRRRSAVGIDGEGKTLFYAYGEEAGPKLIAEALRLVGATAAAELDINWYWTRFLLFGNKPPDSELRVTSTLVPKMEHLRRGYVADKSERDFFYLLRR